MNADIKGEDVAMIVGAPLLVSSSGVEYDLVKVQNREVIDFPLLSIINQILVISAGVSEKTERQIDFALNDGFEAVATDAVTLGSDDFGKLKKPHLKRIIIADGDSSSHALSELDIYALTTRLPLAQTPGSPLWVTRGSNPDFNGLEIALKGGLVGHEDYFTFLKSGF